MTLFYRMLACFIAVTNVPLSIIEEWSFQQLFLLWNPNINFPGRRGIRNLVIKEYKAERERLYDYFRLDPNLKVQMAYVLLS